jgi:hypothetical protein
MPLLDHFHAPLTDEVPWESFQTMWSASIVATLNALLPQGEFQAYAQVHLGTEVEADVAEYATDPSASAGNGEGGGVAVQSYAPSVTVLCMPAVFPDEFEVQVRETRGSRRLVAVVELVSPGNKKEVGDRRAFAAKCLAYLQRGIGLIVIYPVTERRANLHDELVRLMGQVEPFLFPPGTPIYAVAYRPVRRDGTNGIDLWPHPLAVEQPLPVVPLYLKGAFPVPLDLEATYARARQASGI